MKETRKFVRNATDKKAGVAFSLIQAFRCAMGGFVYVVSTQRNIKIYGIFALVALVGGFVLRIEAAAWFAIVLCIAMVFAAECLNTAIESLVDLVSPEYADLAKRAKDCAAAAVLVCAVGSLVVAAIAYLPPLMKIIGAA